MKHERLQRQAVGLLGGYALQFLAGVVLNLFVTIPKAHPGNSGTDYFTRSLHSLVWTLSGSGGWQLAFHVYLGLLLVAGTVGLCISGRLLRNKLWTIVGAVAALLTIGAFFNGMSFVDYNKDISSLIMAICWLGAVSVLIFGLLSTQRKPLKP